MDSRLPIKLVSTLQLSGHNGSIYCMDILNNLVITAGADGWIVKWDPLTNENGQLLAKCNEPIYCIKYTELGIYAGSSLGFVYLIDLNHVVRKIEAHTKGVFFIEPTVTGFLTGGGDGALIHWDLEWNLIKKITLSKLSLRAICKWKNGWAIATSCGKVGILDFNLQLVRYITGHTNSLFALASNHNYLWAGGRNALLSKSDGHNWEYQIAAHTLHIHGLALHPSGSFIASCSMDKSVKIWDLAGNLLKVIDASKMAFHSNCINKVIWLNTETLLSCSDDRTLRMTKILGLV